MLRFTAWMIEIIVRTREDMTSSHNHHTLRSIVIRYSCYTTLCHAMPFDEMPRYAILSRVSQQERERESYERATLYQGGNCAYVRT